MNTATITDHIVLLLDSRGFGGIESHVLQLATALRQAGYPVCVVLLRDYGPHPLEPALTKARVAVVKLHRFGDLLQLLGARPLLLHSHGYKAGILSRLLGAIWSVPVVSSFHAGEPGNGRIRFYNWLDRLSAPLAPAIAVSDKIAATLANRAQVVANFVPPLHDVAPEQTQRIAFVGRLCHDKGADRFCDLAQRHPGGCFAVYGDGPDREQLEARHGDRVNFHGATADMTPCWENIDLLCITSRYEGLPLTALEAMSRGIPVLAFAVGDLPKLIRHRANGWLIAEGDLAEMARCLQCWQQLPASTRAQVSNSARQTIVDSYSPAAVLPQILAIYRRIAPSLKPVQAI